MISSWVSLNFWTNQDCWRLSWKNKTSCWTKPQKMIFLVLGKFSLIEMLKPSLESCNFRFWINYSIKRNKTILNNCWKCSIYEDFTWSIGPKKNKTLMRKNSTLTSQIWSRSSILSIKVTNKVNYWSMKCANIES